MPDISSSPSDPAPTAPVKSLVLDWERLPVRPTPSGARRELFDGPTATMHNLEGHVTTLNPGETAHPPHRHFDEELVVVKDGTLEVTINGQALSAGAGSVFFYASNDLHGMRNAGTTSATYYVLRIETAAQRDAPAGS
jgi:quercetin dioxygenase-like cupin family protein